MAFIQKASLSYYWWEKWEGMLITVFALFSSFLFFYLLFFLLCSHCSPWCKFQIHKYLNLTKYVSKYLNLEYFFTTALFTHVGIIYLHFPIHDLRIASLLTAQTYFLLFCAELLNNNWNFMLPVILFFEEWFIFRMVFHYVLSTILYCVIFFFSEFLYYVWKVADEPPSPVEFELFVWIGMKLRL